MKIDVINASIIDTPADALIVNLFEGVTTPDGATGAVDKALGGMISDLISSGEATGKLMETTLLHTYGRIAPKRVLIIGLGKSRDFDLCAVRKVSGAAVRFLRDKGVKSVTSIVHGAGIGGHDVEAAAQAVVEGTIIGLYRATLYKTNQSPQNELESFAIVEQDASRLPAIENAIHEGVILAEAINRTRDLGNEPSNRMTPIILAERARELAGTYGLDVEILDEVQIKNLKMGGLLGVAQGSAQPPRFIILRYNAGRERPTLVLAGKGITFDTGGISLKSSGMMEHMKFDMCGGAAVIEAMGAIAELRPDINVIGVVPAAENMPSGSALKPGDVITCMNGKTVEITSTDAEGRVILADALTYASRSGADYIVDIATLTTGAIVALGGDYTTIMGNNCTLLDDVKDAADHAGERVWDLPLPSDYMVYLKSSIADFTNCGPRWASAIQGGLFLQEFVDDKPWVHLDIEGSADTYTAETPTNVERYMDAGATGAGVSTMVELAMILARK